jgi:hypothetical protein
MQSHLAAHDVLKILGKHFAFGVHKMSILRSFEGIHQLGLIGFMSIAKSE